MSKLGQIAKNTPWWDKASRWLREPRLRLPEHYKRRRIELEQRVPEPVHYEPDPNKWKVDKWGQRHKVQNWPVNVIYPRQADEGLWGGEGIVKGFRKKKAMGKRNPKFWKPNLMRRVFYSEILDKYFMITVTLRTCRLIDENYGLDGYILKTHEQDLNSKLGMALKKEMLMALSKQSMYPDDPEKKEKLLESYRQCLIPEEEIEWLGLSEEEALEKLEKIEAAENKPYPLKYDYVKDLIQELEDSKASGELEKETGGISKFISKWSPFEVEKDPESKDKDKTKS